ncbi:MAG: arginine--tRNA ligase, partial [Bacteroidota bacterium]
MIEELLVLKTCEAISALYLQTVEPSSVGFEKTKKEISGDYTIIVFPYSRISKKSPEATANEIGHYLSEKIEEIASYNVIKGFLNIELKSTYWTSFLHSHYKNEEFGFVNSRENKPILVEFSSPNTNKPLHLGHIRNNLLGSSLSEILKANGHQVIKLNLVNDRGIHICKSMIAYLQLGNGETPTSSGLKGDHLVGKYYVLFDQQFKLQVKELKEQGMNPEEAEKRAPILDEARQLLIRWEAGDPEVISLWKK